MYKKNLRCKNILKVEDISVFYIKSRGNKLISALTQLSEKDSLFFLFILNWSSFAFQSNFIDYRIAAPFFEDKESIFLSFGKLINDNAKVRSPKCLYMNAYFFYSYML